MDSAPLPSPPSGGEGPGESGKHGVKKATRCHQRTPPSPPDGARDLPALPFPLTQHAVAQGAHAEPGEDERDRCDDRENRC